MPPPIPTALRQRMWAIREQRPPSRGNVKPSSTA
jgi:hypothetical protein